MQMQIFKFMIIIKDVTSLHHDTSKCCNPYIFCNHISVGER